MSEMRPERAFPLGFFEALVAESGATDGVKPIDWRALKALFAQRYDLVVNYGLAWASKKRFTDRGIAFPSSFTDMYLSRDERGRPVVLPVDPQYFPSRRRACTSYRWRKAFLHELVHVLDWSHPGLLCPSGPRWAHHKVGIGVPEVRATGDLSPHDSTDVLREMVVEQLSCLLLVPPQGVRRAILENLTQLQLATRFRASLDDIQDLTRTLLMSSSGELGAVELEVEELLDLMRRPGYDPIEALVLSLAAAEPLPELLAEPPSEVVVDLDVEALDSVRKLQALLSLHVSIVSERGYEVSPFPILLESFIRRHSGSELRFLVRKGAGPVLWMSLDAMRRGYRHHYYAFAALICGKLGFPEVGLELIEQSPDANCSVRLLEARGFCQLATNSEAAARQAVATYGRAYELAPENPEVRFGLLKAIGRSDGDGAARTAADEFGGPSHWLEGYYLAKLAYQAYRSNGQRTDLLAAERKLLTVLDVDLQWPPRIVELAEIANASLTDGLEISSSHFLRIDGDRKKAINLLAKICEHRGEQEDRQDFKAVGKALLMTSYDAHRFDSKTNFCLYEYYVANDNTEGALLRLRELMHLRPGDPVVLEYLRAVIRREFEDWTYLASGIETLIRRLECGSQEMT